MLTSNHPNNELIKFRTDVASDFLRSSRFDPFMGDTSTSVIVRMSDLQTDGKEINVPLVTQLSGSGGGASTLRGNEEQIDSYGMPLWADWARNAGANNRAANKESSFNVRSTARQLLRGWARRIVRDDLVDALLSIPSASIQAGRMGNPGNRVNGIKWSAATTGNKNSWVTANYDRVLFGSVVGNYSSTFATAAANVDSTSDKMSAAVGSLAKNIAQQTGVDYTNPDARNREHGDPTKQNPLFTGGGLVYDGEIYLEIPEITQRLLLKSIGNGSIDVEPFFLCGQGAMAYVVGQMPRPTTLEDGEYDFITGLGIEAQYGTGKIAKAPLCVSGASVGVLVVWGLVSGFVFGVAF